MGKDPAKRAGSGRKVVTLVLLILAVGGVFAWFRWKPASAEAAGSLWITPKKGKFEVSVTATGELQAKNSVKVRAPDNIRKAEIWQLKIQTLLPEGTVVQAGDMVAQLDKSELMGKIKEAQIAFNKAQAQFTQARLDCTITLSQAREEIVTQKFALEENRLKKEQSKFEAPAVIRQTEIEYEKALRQQKQSQNNYVTKVSQAKAKMEEVGAEVETWQNKIDELSRLAEDFTILAPENGMVIYKRNWNGKKIQQGDQISTWDPTVATLPDLSVMESIAYINEIDIRKISEGQSVRIGLDADPSKKLSGKIDFKANIGEQRPGSESKVFEVKILVNEKDTTLRPSMTTSNQVVIETLENVMYIPIECLVSEGDKTFVQVKTPSGSEKKAVITGAVNENEVVIKSGLAGTEQVMLSVPDEDSPSEKKSPDKNDDSEAVLYDFDRRPLAAVSASLSFLLFFTYGIPFLAQRRHRRGGVGSK